MERNKRARKPLRTAITKALTEVETELKKEQPDPEILLEKLRKIESLELRLSEADTKILEELLDGTDTEYEAEFGVIEEYSDKVRSVKLKIGKVVNNGSTPEVASIEANYDLTRKFKLPKIELKKFNGELHNWLSWWSQFQKIHSDESLHPTDKFQYLMQATVEGSRARRLVDGYPQTAENYPKVIDAMCERFGDKTILTEMYVRRLAGLVIANASKPKSTSLSIMFDELESSIRSLESLGVTSDQSAAFLYPLVESSLPQEVLRVWQRSPMSGYEAEEEQRVDERLNSLMKFLKKEVRGEERLAFVTAGITPPEKRKRLQQGGNTTQTPPTAAALVSVESKCLFCEKPHESRDCGKASLWPLDDRKKRVEDKRGCFTCLKIGHTAKNCKTFVKCAVCTKRHTVLLCPEVAKIRKDTQSVSTKAVENVMTTLTYSPKVILQTVTLEVCGPKGTRKVRAMIDTGSQKSYLLQSTAKRLGLKAVRRERFAHAVFGGTVSNIRAHDVYVASVKSVVSNFKTRLNVLGQSKICSYSPQIEPSMLSHLAARVANFGETMSNNNEIEVLLGADHYASLLTGQMSKVTDKLMLIETKFGWTLIGQLDTFDRTAEIITNIVLSPNEVSNLWRLELLGIRDPIEVKSDAEQNEIAYKTFEKTVTRDAEGRYVVALPWKDEHGSVENNRVMAEKRLQLLTKKLRENNQFDVYNDVIRSWLEEGLIECCENEIGGFYLPHRPVWKPESVSTPVRPVFDASAKCGNNPSLNDMLYKGPNLLEIIPTILLRFRRYKIGFSADIRKAFQTLVVRNEDRPFLRFLWWTKDGVIKAFQHTRVVFGVKSSPFLLAAVLKLHLSSVQEKAIADKLAESFYVDNCVDSVATMNEFEEFRRMSTQILSQARMELRQWEVTIGDGSGVGQLHHSSCGLDPGNGSLQDFENKTTTILGVGWDKMTDRLACIAPDIHDEKITKKYVLSLVSKIFDPIGILAPVTLIPKTILQEAWLQKLGWDQELPEESQQKFKRWLREIPMLHEVSIPRHVYVNGIVKGEELHTFCDASSYAYGCVIYLKSWSEEGVKVQLVAAKARVAPIKKPTIPRLELLGCVVGARLYDFVINALQLSDVRSHFWTDSSCALAWVQGNSDWGTFVANRVAQIRKLTRLTDWHHIPGDMNPADIVSRGCSVNEVISTKWWEGPKWLSKSHDEWPNSTPQYNSEQIDSELKKTSVAMLNTKVTQDDLFKASHYLRNLRIVAWIRRFICRCKRFQIHTGCLKASELNEAEIALFRYIQRSSFPSFQDVIGGVKVIRDESGLLRVHTKLLYRQDFTAFKAPALLPPCHPIVEQLVLYHHLIHGHAGVQFLMGKLREWVWIIHARKTIKRIVRSCVICKKQNGPNYTTEQAPLPSDRVDSSRAFQVTGVDLAGPLFLKTGQKCWVVLFTCAMFRCVHLEVVTSLSTDSFLLAFQKFVCRRGRPSVVWSDNGTNFRGSANAMRAMKWAEIENFGAVSRIQWKFIPPGGPWWGGWWERLIGLLKGLMRRMLGNRKLNLVQLESMLCVAETTMNERPLTYVSNDANDLVPLTPQMFLHDIRSSQFPEIGLVDGAELRKRVCSLKTMRKELVDRFRKEYLSQLVHRGGSDKGATINVGDVVLVGTETKRCLWPMGKIEKLLPGRDGHSRIAEVKVRGGVLIRPVRKLYQLEASNCNFPNPELQTRESGDDNARSRFGRQIKKPQRLGYS